MKEPIKNVFAIIGAYVTMKQIVKLVKDSAELAELKRNGGK